MPFLVTNQHCCPPQLGGDGGGAPVGNGVDDWDLSVFVFDSGERERERI